MENSNRNNVFDTLKIFITSHTVVLPESVMLMKYPSHPLYTSLMTDINNQKRPEVGFICDPEDKGVNLVHPFGTLAEINKKSITVLTGENSQEFLAFEIAGLCRFWTANFTKAFHLSAGSTPTEAEITPVIDKKMSVTDLAKDQTLKHWFPKINDIVSLLTEFLEEKFFPEILFNPNTYKEENFENLQVGHLSDKLAFMLGLHIFAPHVFNTVKEQTVFEMGILKEVDLKKRFKKIIERWDVLLKKIHGPSKKQTMQIVPVFKKVAQTEQPGTNEDYEENEELIELLERFEKIKEKLKKDAIEEIESAFRDVMSGPPSGNTTEYQNNLRFLRYAIEWYELKPKKDREDINEVERILNEDHYGLKKPKTRILEEKAARKLNPDKKAPILCFVGPPGVGKTSLGQSIARALGRKFTRKSVGGIRDEADIRGFRRTYIGAKPGDIIDHIKKTWSSNPVFMLDEIDKICGPSHNGDPEAALLEVLDPEQNFSFKDHYLHAGIDLSKVFFITTANTVEPIPPALKDRMQIIRLPGYTEEEKVGIAKDFLVPKQIREHKLSAGVNVEPFFSLIILRYIIRSYTWEAGVRNLERCIADVCRKLSYEFEKGNISGRSRICKDTLLKFLGPPRFSVKKIPKKLDVGVFNGLAWTENGGELLIVQVEIFPEGDNEIILTGSLGDVMQESVETARSLVRARASKRRYSQIQNDDFHFHSPEGAVPKEGPSAGLAFALAAYSAAKSLGKPRSEQVRAMSIMATTGEIDLKGNILPIGGLKEKLVGAMRSGIKEVILPKANEKDLSDLETDSDLYKKINSGQLKLHYVTRFSQALSLAYPNRKKKRKK